jgi:putative endonuclease
MYFLSFMAGLGPAIHDCIAPHQPTKSARMAEGWVYIMTNRPNGTLYVGVTDNLARRAWEHREGVADGFTKRYGLKRLVYAERYPDIRSARQREQNLKHYRRAWKVRLILVHNPDWAALYDSML